MQMRQKTYDDIVAWSNRGYPNEVVALLLGYIDDADGIVIDNYVPVVNLAVDALTQFVLDPQGWLIADATAQALGVEIVGIIHTHPDAVPYPSIADNVSADLLGSRFAYLIASVTADGGVSMLAWRWNGRAFSPQRFICR